MEELPTNDNVARNSIVEPNIERQESFSDLPPEMLERILNKVTAYDLLHCRQVNYQWNQISSRIMHGVNYNMYFGLFDGKYVQKTQHRCCHQCSICCCKLMPTSGSKTLTDLVSCLENSTLFPYTYFIFEEMSMESFKSMSHFLTLWGSHIRFLAVTLSGTKEVVAILLILLLQKVPNLKRFAFVHDPHISPSIPSSIPLLADSHQLQLPKLELLCSHDPSRICTAIMKDILIASPNLKEFSKSRCTVLAEDLEMLNKSNKLHCLRQLSISITEDLIAYWKRSQIRFDLQLRSLTLSIEDIIYLDHQLNASATEIINQLLYSSRKSIQILVTEPLGPLIGLVFPTLNQLRHLRLRHDRAHNDHKMFPLSFDWPNKFPNIKVLDIEHYNGQPNVIFDDSLKALLSVETLRFSWIRNSRVFGELIKRTPNVRTLVIDDHSSFVSSNGVPQQNQRINFKDICIYLPKLRDLSWKVHVRKPLRYKLDALITGLPDEYCKKLAMASRNEHRLSVDEIETYWSQRDFSIFNVKELTSFHLHFEKCFNYREEGANDSDGDGGGQSTDTAEIETESIFYEIEFSKLSKFIGFDQRPDLNIVIHDLTRSKH